MSDGLFGYNINLGGLKGRDAEAQADARAADAHAHLLMTVPGSGIDGPGEINQLRDWEDALDGSTIIRRTYNRHEGDWSLHMPPKEQVQIWKGQGLFSMLHDAPSNEPSLSGTNEEVNRRFVARETEMVYRSADANIKYLSGAFSVGTPHETLIRRGVYDPLLQALHDTREVGGGISAHLYGLANLEAGERVGYDALLDPQRARQAMTDIPWSYPDRFFLLRRPDEFVLRAIEMGISIPNVYATEAKVDLIPDANWVLNQLRSRFGRPEYNFDMRGIQSIELYLKAMLPEMSFQEAVAFVTEYAGRNIFYPDYIKAVILFALNWLWDRPQGHNYFNPSLDTYRKVYLPAINKRLRGKTVTIPPFPDTNDERWKEGKIVADNTNVRSKPRRGQNVVGRIYQPVDGFILTEEKHDDLNNENYTWVPVRYVDEGGIQIKGYIASGYYTFDDKVIPDVPDIPDETLPDDTDVVTQEMVDEAVLKYLQSTEGDKALERVVVANMNLFSDKIFEVMLREWDNHISTQPLADLPLPLVRLISRVGIYTFKSIDPDKQPETSPN